MKFTCLGSSSKGNCYLLQSESGECLMIEAGINFSKVKQAINFKISNIVGCVVSHIHFDHSKFANDILNCLIPVYTSETTKSELGIENNRLISVEPLKAFFVGDFKIIAFDVPHDCRCFGYLINHKECGNILFATDCSDVPYKFNNLNHVLIEANYSDEELARSIENGLNPIVAKRVIGTHLELYACRDVLLRQDLSNVYNIVLIHLSQNNSDEKKFKEALSRATGKPIQVAKPGLEIELNNKPY